MGWRWGLPVTLLLVAVATATALAVLNPVTMGSEAPAASSGDALSPAEPIDIRRFNGSLEASVGLPTGHVIVGPTSNKRVDFDAGSRGTYMVGEVAWSSDRIQELGAVLFVYRGSSAGYGYVDLTTDLNWEYAADVTGPSPLYLVTPITPGARYSWSVYPLPDQVIERLDFESAMSLFDTTPPANYWVFPPTG